MCDSGFYIVLGVVFCCVSYGLKWIVVGERERILGEMWSASTYEHLADVVATILAITTI